MRSSEHLEAIRADAGAVRDDYPVSPLSHEPRSTAEAAPWQRAQCRTNVGLDRPVYHSRHLVRWSAGRHPGADAIQRGF